MDFSISLNHTEVGVGWATWSHSYTGDVYWTQGATSVTLTLPTGTGAFYFYAEPDPFDVYTIKATSADGSTVTQSVDGYYGAAGYGFYGVGTTLSTITVTSDMDFAIGEFGIAGAVVPLPAAALLGFPLLVGLAFARRFRRRS